MIGGGAAALSGALLLGRRGRAGLPRRRGSNLDLPGEETAAAVAARVAGAQHLIEFLSAGPSEQDGAGAVAGGRSCDRFVSSGGIGRKS